MPGSSLSPRDRSSARKAPQCHSKEVFPPTQVITKGEDKPCPHSRLLGPRWLGHLLPSLDSSPQTHLCPHLPTST